MEVGASLSFQEELKGISTLVETNFANGSSKVSDPDECNDKTKIFSIKCQNLKEPNVVFQKKCVELGPEDNESSVSNNTKSVSSQDDAAESRVKSSSSSTPSPSSSDEHTDDESLSESEPEENDGLKNGSILNEESKENCELQQLIKSTSHKGSSSLSNKFLVTEDDLESADKAEELENGNQDLLVEKIPTTLALMKGYHLDDNKDISICLSSSSSNNNNNNTRRSKSVKRKRENVQTNSDQEEDEHNKSKMSKLEDNSILIPINSIDKNITLNINENITFKNVNKDKYNDENDHILNNSGLTTDSIELTPTPEKSISTNLIKTFPNKNKVRPRSRLKANNTSLPENLLDQVASAFAEQLTGLNLSQLTPFQTSQLSLVLEKQPGIKITNWIHSTTKTENEPHRETITSTCSSITNTQVVSTPLSSPASEVLHRLSSDTEDMLPIQPEVVMSDGSENGMEEENEEDEEVLDEEAKVNQEVATYLQSFLDCSTLTQGGTIVEFPPANNELPPPGSDLTAWQLDKVALPPFTPFVAPPSWLRLTIPPEGYKCHSCGDTFFIESSLSQHRARRSLLIILDCASCDTQVKFYNKCALKDHVRVHALRGESVGREGERERESLVLKPLPLGLAKLSQPILVPVPRALLTPMKSSQQNSLSFPAKKSLPSNFGAGFLPPSFGKENSSPILGGALSPPPFHEEGEEGGNEIEEGKTNAGGGGGVFLGGCPPPPVLPHLPPAPPTVRCYLCDRVFRSVRELMSHMRTNQRSSDQRVECRKCLLVLPSVCAAKAHILTHPPANSSNISVCPECGSRCDGPRDFVHHLNTCGHQYRRSGVLCGQCHVCFFKFGEDFLSHWIKEHCARSYECVVCGDVFDSLVLHKCSGGDAGAGSSSPPSAVQKQVLLATFKCLLTCPLCPYVVQLHTQQPEERETQDKVRSHLSECHPSALNRVHFVYKSKFCTNAFRSKDELRAHHDREHRRDNHYRTKTCTLHHEVLGFQHQYFNGQEPRNAFVTMPVTLSAEEREEALTRAVPTVSSVVDKTLFPDCPMTLEALKGLKAGGSGPAEKDRRLVASASVSAEGREVDVGSHPLLLQKDNNNELPSLPPPPSSSSSSPTKPDSSSSLAPHLSPSHPPESPLRPCVCYRCGYTYTFAKDFRRHRRSCEGEGALRVCLVCGVSAVGEAFARHVLGHIRAGHVLCIYCNGAPFASPHALHQHFQLHVHEQISYPAVCPFCSTAMPDVNAALIHLQEEHTPRSPPSSPLSPSSSSALEALDVECDRCGRKFHGERGLNVHLTRCTVGTAPPAPVPAGGRQCHVCKKALTAEMFGKHVTGHLEEGLLACCLCDAATLPSSVALLVHLEGHAASLEFPFECPVCPAFRMTGEAEALLHLKEDHGFGSLPCPSCDMRYTFTYQLSRHRDIVHRVCLYAKRRYICWICRAYDHVKKETLMNHFRTIHGLSTDEVDEKVMIRTRGQGTMPTSQFIPTKPLGSKELGGGKADFKGFKLSPDSLLRGGKGGKGGRPPSKKKSPKKEEGEEEEGEREEGEGERKMEINLDNIVIKKELLDVINSLSDDAEEEEEDDDDDEGEDTKTTDSKRKKQPAASGRAGASTAVPTKRSAPEDEYSRTATPQGWESHARSQTKLRLTKKGVSSRSRDRKLRDRTKVMIKRLPESLLASRSRGRRKGNDKRRLRLKGEMEEEGRVTSPLKDTLPVKIVSPLKTSKLEATSPLKTSKLEATSPLKSELETPMSPFKKIEISPLKVKMEEPTTAPLKEGGDLEGGKWKEEEKEVKKEKAFKCQVCPFKTNSRTKLEHHCARKKHPARGGKPGGEMEDGFVCRECGQSFVVEPSLKRHLFFAHKIKQAKPPEPSLPQVQPQLQPQPPAGGGVVRPTGGIPTRRTNNHNRAKRTKRKNPPRGASSSTTTTRTATRTTTRLNHTYNHARHHLPIITRRRPNLFNIRRNDLPKSAYTTTSTEEVKKERGAAENDETDVGGDEKVSELQCCVCREVFDTSVKLYSHLRTHGMAFLKLGTKKRGFATQRQSIKC